MKWIDSDVGYFFGFLFFVTMLGLYVAIRYVLNCVQ